MLNGGSIRGRLPSIVAHLLPCRGQVIPVRHSRFLSSLGEEGWRRRKPKQWHKPSKINHLIVLLLKNIEHRESMAVLNIYISVICICLGFRYSNFEFMENILYSSRECSTNQTFYAKQTQSQVLRIWLSSFVTSKYVAGTFGEMRKQSQFKPNTNPIQSQTNPFVAQKSGGQTQTKPIQILCSKCAEAFAPRIKLSRLKCSFGPCGP